MSASQSSQVDASGTGWSLDDAASAPRQSPASQRFARHHPWDRNFFLVYVVLIWVGILSGFVPQVIKHINTHAPAYPPIVHIHAVVFVGWLVLLTSQVLLIRSARLHLHRALGIAGA